MGNGKLWQILMVIVPPNNFPGMNGGCREVPSVFGFFIRLVQQRGILISLTGLSSVIFDQRAGKKKEDV